LGTLIGAGAAPSGEIEVDTTRLDDLKPPGSRVDLVKIGAQGAELRILAGMQRLITDNPGLVVVAEFRPSFLRAQGVSTAAWLEAFAQAGLKVATELDESARAVAPLRPGDALDQVFSINFSRPRLKRWLLPMGRGNDA
jgi:hypothetical protein